MKLIHGFAIAFFVIAFIFSGGNLATGVDCGASWGFGTAIAISILAFLIALLVLFTGSAAGGVAGGVVTESVGGFIFGSVVGGGLSFLYALKIISKPVLAAIGYWYLDEWAITQEPYYAQVGLVLLGISLVMSYFVRKNTSSSSSK